MDKNHIMRKSRKILTNNNNPGKKFVLNFNSKSVSLTPYYSSTVDHLTDDGSIYVSLCNGQGGTAADHPRRDWCNNWQIVAQAACAELVLSEAVPFLSHNFQEYSSTGFRWHM